MNFPPAAFRSSTTATLLVVALVCAWSQRGADAQDACPPNTHTCCSMLSMGFTQALSRCCTGGVTEVGLDELNAQLHGHLLIIAF
jgi:hypothetical protein